MRYLLPAVLATCLLFSGCYQAQMTTGKAPSNTVVEKKWAPSYLYGLVGAEIDVSDECENGIASAERKFTFPNLLVNTLTLGIYLPQNVTVTCAADGSMSAATEASAGMEFTLAADATEMEIKNVLTSASIHSSITDNPVRIRVAQK